MTTPQRGQFSAHKGLVNSTPSAKSTDPARLAQLSQENAQLKNKIKQVMAELTPIINGLAQQIAQLKQQVEAKKVPLRRHPKRLPGRRLQAPLIPLVLGAPLNALSLKCPRLIRGHPHLARIHLAISKKCPKKTRSFMQRLRV